jgi:hypothetical protein
MAEEMSQDMSLSRVADDICDSRIIIGIYNS